MTESKQSRQGDAVRNNLKGINKNVKPEMKEMDILEKDILDTEGGEIEVIKIIRGDDDMSSALMDMEIILHCFNRYPVLFWLGDLYIHLAYDKLVYAEVLSNSNAKTIPFERLVDIACTDQTFLAFWTNGYKVDVLPKNARTYLLFDKLGILEKSKHSKVSIEFKDLLPIHYKEKKRKRKNISGNSNSKQKTYISNRYNHETIPIRMERHAQMFCPRKADRLRIYKQYIIADGTFHFPTQVTADYYDNELEQQVPSEVMPSLYNENDEAFALPVNIPSDIAPSRHINFSIHDSSRSPREFYTYNASRQSTNVHIFDSPSRPINVQTNNSSSHSNFQTNDSSSSSTNVHTNNSTSTSSSQTVPSRHGEFVDYRGIIATYQTPTSTQLNEEEFVITSESNPNELSTYRHPEYWTMEARLSSFTNWPRDMIQTPQRLAEAGLYYNGIADHVRCFACDGGLRCWDPEDDPWTEHCRWFPACPFAIEQKGEEFIALVQVFVVNEIFEASGGGGSNDNMIDALERLRIRELETETVMKQHEGPICRDMGFEKAELKEAVLELNERGNKNPSIEDIVDVIEIIRDRKYADMNNESNLEDESPTAVNRRLKNQVYCIKCKENNTNALFLPCTHHKLCMSCADPLQTCPVCRRTIKEKIRTYLV